jgi:AcrR family transcriptional regulator
MSAPNHEERRRRSRREERKKETRAELIAAAARVFARRGFHGASLQEIGREAGYSTGAIYWYFQGKDDLFLAVYESYATTRVREWEEIHASAEGDFAARARVYADQWMERLRREPEFMVLSLEFLVHAWRNPQLREAFGHRLASGRLALARLLEEAARADGVQLPMGPDHLATALRELGSGLALAKLADPEGIPDRLFGDFIELVFRLLADQDKGQGKPQADQLAAPDADELR